jgi:hypothetical protein
METRTYNVYKFHELPKESQQKAIENWRKNDSSDIFLPANMREYAHELLEENGITTHPFSEHQEQKDEHGNYLDYDVAYSLSYSQGDGAMITLTDAKWAKYPEYSINIKHAGRHYHENSKQIDMHDEEGNEAPDEVLNAFNTLYVKICKELAKRGYDDIKYHQSDEFITETFEANDFDFTLDGKID